MSDQALDSLQAQFPILEHLTLLNHAGVAPLSAPAAEAMRQYADQAQNRGYFHADWHRRIAAVRAAIARLIGADGPNEIAFTPNTSTGLSTIAKGLDWRRGDNVVITNVEFPANRYPWEDLKRFGVQLIEVPQQPDGRIHAEDVIEAITDRTRVTAISHVQYATGHRIDLAPISEMAHRAGAYLCVDAIQSVGVLPVDVQAMGIDFLSADSHKWMLGPEGAGVLYCREDLIPLLHPNVVGWANMVNALDFGGYEFAFQPDARRFEPGSFNIAGILAMGASIDLLLKIGVVEIWSRVEALTARLCEGLERKQYRVFSPREKESERSGIVIFDPPYPDMRLTPSVRRIVADLEKQDIVIVARQGRLRASPHFYNTFDQMDALVDALP